MSTLESCQAASPDRLVQNEEALDQSDKLEPENLLNSLSSSLNEMNDQSNDSKTSHDNQKSLSVMRHELTSLITVDTRIRQCQLMSREIEEFESRVQKVEEFIRNDDLVMLANLVVY